MAAPAPQPMPEPMPEPMAAPMPEPEPEPEPAPVEAAEPEGDTEPEVPITEAVTEVVPVPPEELVARAAEILAATTAPAQEVVPEPAATTELSFAKVGKVPKGEQIGTSSLADLLGLGEEMSNLPSPQAMEAQSSSQAKRQTPTNVPQPSEEALGLGEIERELEKPQRITHPNPKAVKLPPETEERKKARHTARGLVSQMFASNKKLVQESLRKGTFYDSLKEHLTSARREYERQVSSQIREEFDYFQLELDVRIQAMKKELN
jgi:hypothetical protein